MSKEAKDFVNTGDNNTGSYNTGNQNSGDCNSGKYNIGNDNTGNNNLGNRNSGDWNMCDHASGCFNTIEQPIYSINLRFGLTMVGYAAKLPQYYPTLD